jgi:uncharacterized protein YjiS (DUF1127 family)
MLQDLQRWLSKRQRIRLSIITLEGLDDRLLADMGIPRGEIAARVAGRPARRPAPGPAGTAAEKQKAAGTSPDGRRLAAAGC